MKTSTATVAAMALAGVTAGSALATPKSLTLEAGGIPLAPGAPIAVSSSNFLIRTEAGSVTCQDTNFAGKLGTNGETKSDTMELTEAVFAGEEPEGRCVSTIAEPLNEVTVTTTSLPWTVTLTPKGQLTILTKVILRVSPLHPPYHPPETCVITTSSFRNGSFPTNGEPLNVTFTAIKTQKGGDSGAECRTHPVISATFDFTSGGQPVTAVLH